MKPPDGVALNGKDSRLNLGSEHHMTTLAELLTSSHNNSSQYVPNMSQDLGSFMLCMTSEDADGRKVCSLPCVSPPKNKGERSACRGVAVRGVCALKSCFK